MREFRIIAHNEKSLHKLYNIPSRIKSGVHQAYIEIAKDLKDTVKKDFRAKKSGRIYIKRLRGRLVRHRASAPGEPPAKFTGALDMSIATKTSGYTQLDFSAGNEKAPYAAFLENGTRIMAKRPYMIKSVRENERNTVEAFYTYISCKLNEA